MLNIGINGFGRIGRQTFRILLGNNAVRVVAINDLTDSATLAHLLKYDSLYGELDRQVAIEGDNMVVDGRQFRVWAEREPSAIPWGELGVDLVIEATGKFRTHPDASRHLQGGAKRVIVTTPVNDADLVVVMGINEHLYDPRRHRILSNASCTTNGLAPVVKVLHERFGIVRGLMNTTHSYTNDQNLLDLPHPDLRRARAANLNIIPTTTGAARVIGKLIPDLEGLVDGFAVRVPTATVSMVDFVCEVRRETSAREVNNALREAAENQLKGILGYSSVPLVSMDYRGTSYSSVVDSLLTMVVDGRMVRVVAWYDNEWGYSSRVADLAAYVAKAEAGEKENCGIRQECVIPG